MTRFLATAALVLAASSPALAQDMPLAQILIDGEGWKKVPEPGKKPPPQVPAPPVDPDSRAYGVATYSADHGTIFAAVPGERFLWAMPTNDIKKAARYAPLRLKRGEKSIDVTSLLADKDGRIYAATEIGVQVFDPTGRLCGVLTPAAEGKPEHLAFEGDKLTLWIGDTKYARKLDTTGAKP